MPYWRGIVGGRTRSRRGARSCRGPPRAGRRASRTRGARRRRRPAGGGTRTPRCPRSTPRSSRGTLSTSSCRPSPRLPIAGKAGRRTPMLWSSCASTTCSRRARGQRATGPGRRSAGRAQSGAIGAWRRRCRWTGLGPPASASALLRWARRRRWRGTTSRCCASTPSIRSRRDGTASSTGSRPGWTTRTSSSRAACRRRRRIGAAPGSTPRSRSGPRCGRSSAWRRSWISGMPPC
mmetsp:Transcript_77580/g.203686  ORF Transcript_77580/g.203686 Transcript_77580/m.203686 type:complete len:235 (+) Transcript_77580:61-765(+)